MLPFPVSILVIEQNGFGGEKKTILFGDRTEQWIKKSVLDVIGAFLELMKTKRVLYFGKKKKKKGITWKELDAGTHTRGELPSSFWQAHVCLFSCQRLRRVTCPSCGIFLSVGMQR